MRATRTVDYALDSTVRLDDLRMIVAETQGIAGSAIITFTKVEGQLESFTQHVVITEENESK